MTIRTKERISWIAASIGAFLFIASAGALGTIQPSPISGVVNGILVALDSSLAGIR